MRCWMALNISSHKIKKCTMLFRDTTKLNVSFVCLIIAIQIHWVVCYKYTLPIIKLKLTREDVKFSYSELLHQLMRRKRQYVVFFQRFFIRNHRKMFYCAISDFQILHKQFQNGARIATTTLNALQNAFSLNYNESSNCLQVPYSYVNISIHHIFYTNLQRKENEVWPFVW